MKTLFAFSTFITASLSFFAHAVPDYIVTLRPNVDAGEVERVDARLRVLSVATGEGSVVHKSERGRWVANLSRNAAVEIRDLPAVASVFEEVQFESTGAPVRTADNVDRVITFESDFPPDLRATLVSTIKRWSRETGTGHVRIISDDVLVANLSSKAKYDLAATRGVYAVEDERAAGTPSPCDPTREPDQP